MTTVARLLKVGVALGAWTVLSMTGSVSGLPLGTEKAACSFCVVEPAATCILNGTSSPKHCDTATPGCWSI